VFTLRNVLREDIDDLHQLSQLGNFINLPSDREKLSELIQSSLDSFKNPSARSFSENFFLFVLYSHEQKRIVGTANIHSQHGSEQSPHYSLIVPENENESLVLRIEKDGPTEIGGLVVDSSLRGHPGKLGKQISFVRFFYMGLYPELFKNTIHSELMPLFNKNDGSDFWESYSKNFSSLSYHEADSLSLEDPFFIEREFPKIGPTLSELSIKARYAFTKVNAKTMPVKKMLTSLGFNHNHEVDPLDSGPHFQCQLDEISVVKKIKRNVAVLIQNDLTELEPYLIKIENHANKDVFFAAQLIYGKLDGNTFTTNNVEVTKAQSKAVIMPLSY
jgi:arginine N-succinyltransferase